ncbi:MAG: DUF3052 family protein [Varibaculum sp.]|nr:DUF3052 family protein [Varibaculum sp.]
MSNRTGAATGGEYADLGFTLGQVIQEFGWDDDVDESLRERIADDTGEEMPDEDYTDIADGAILWWRFDDGDADDLADLLTDAIANLDEGGTIWVLTPKSPRSDAVQLRLVSDAATTAGVNPTSTEPVAADWIGTRIQVKPRA